MERKKRSLSKQTVKGKQIPKKLKKAEIKGDEKMENNQKRRTNSYKYVQKEKKQN